MDEPSTHRTSKNHPLSPFPCPTTVPIQTGRALVQRMAPAGKDSATDPLLRYLAKRSKALSALQTTVSQGSGAEFGKCAFQPYSAVKMERHARASV